MFAILQSQSKNNATYIIFVDMLEVLSAITTITSIRDQRVRMRTTMNHAQHRVFHHIMIYAIIVVRDCMLAKWVREKQPGRSTRKKHLETLENDKEMLVFSKKHN